MPTLVKLPARSPEGMFELIAPDTVAAIVACHDGNRCLVRLRNDSEEGGYWIQLSQQEVANRLGITVADSVVREMSLGTAIDWMMERPKIPLIDSDGNTWRYSEDQGFEMRVGLRGRFDPCFITIPDMAKRTFHEPEYPAAC